MESCEPKFQFHQQRSQNIWKFTKMQLLIGKKYMSTAIPCCGRHQHTTIFILIQNFE